MLRRFAAAALAAALSTACTHLGAGQRTAPRDTVRIGLYEEPDSLNPIISSMAFTTDVDQLIYDGLIRIDDHAHAVPDLAAALPTRENGGISRDGLTITYRLVRNAVWSDGVPLTARDVVFTWRQIMNPANNTPTRAGYDKIAAIDAPDPYTVRIRLKSPYPPILFLFSSQNQGAIVPEHVLRGNANINRTPFNTGPIGSGPYVLRRWTHGSEMRFDANPRYFRGVPKIAHVIVKFLSDQNTLVAQLQSHEIDFDYDVPPSQTPAVRALPGIALATTSSLDWEHINFNTQRPPLDDARVRRALVTATDETAIFAKVYHGLGRAAPVHFNPDFGWGDTALRPYPYDLRAAGALLDAAGWKLDGDGVRRRGGVPLAFAISTVAGVKQREAIEVLLQSGWRTLGAQVTVKNFPAATLFAPRAAGGVLYGGKTDVAIFTWDNVTPDPDDQSYIAPDRLPPEGENTSFFVDPEIGRLQAAGLATYDVAKRRAPYRKIADILYREVPEYVLDWLPETDAYYPELHGVKPAPVGSDLWNIADWSFSDGTVAGG